MYEQIKYSLATIILAQITICLSMNQSSEISLTLSKEIKNIKQDHCLTCLTLSDDSNLLIKNGKVYKENFEYYSVHQKGQFLFLKNKNKQCKIVNLENDKTIFQSNKVKSHKILGRGRYILLELNENKVQLIDLQDTQKIYDFNNIYNAENTYNNFLVLTMTDEAKEIINLKNPEIRIRIENFIEYRLLGQTKLLVIYKDNSASIYDLEAGEQLQKFENINDYHLYVVSTSDILKPFLHYKYNVIYLQNKKSNTLYYLGTNKFYNFKKIVQQNTNFTFLAIKKNDNSFTLIDFINNKTYDKIESYSYNRNCKYCFVKFNDTKSGILFDLEKNNKIIREFQDVDSFNFIEKNNILLIKFGKTSPKILNLEDNSFIEIELYNNTDSLSFLNKKLLCLICINQKNKFWEIINLETKAKMIINNPCKNGLQKLKPKNLYLANFKNGTKQLIETEKCMVLKTFKSENNARVINNFLIYKEKNTQKLLNLALTIITAV